MRDITAETRALQKRAHEVIPGGAHTYSKGDDQYPASAPPFLVRGAGCRVWDRDGNEYIEYGMGLRAVTLGHAHARVNAAVVDAIQRGLNFTRPSTLELETAEMLQSFVASAEMVKFAKNGSDATTAAVKLARAYTGREMVAICGDHPFFSVDDWFIGTTPMNAGVPDAERARTVKFRYNDIEDLRRVFAEHPGRIACVVMEAETTTPPLAGYLAGVQALCRASGTVFVLDEMITGFRWHTGGAQCCYDLSPDLSAFGKGMANGFAASALVGRRDIMQLGGLHHDRDRVFLLSTTHGADHSGLAAALETMRVYRDEDVIATLRRQGLRLREGVEQVARSAGLDRAFTVAGHPANLVFRTADASGVPSPALRALFMQELIARGVIGPSFVVSAAHTDADIDATVEAVAGALAVYARALNEGVDALLAGGPTQPVFRRRN